MSLDSLDAPLTPGYLMEMSGGYWRGCALHAAVELDLFTGMGEAGRSAEAVARECACDLRATAMLLDALCAMNLLTKDAGTYHNTALSQEFLVRTAPRYMGYILLHHKGLMASWNQLEQSVRSGGPIRGRTAFDGRGRENFLMGMFNMASGMAPRVLAALDLSDRTHLLDLGGGPGTYALHFCQANPQLRATVLDQATTEPFANRIIKRFKLEDRVTFRPGDFSDDEYGGPYNVAWLSHVLHAESPNNCQKMLAKSVQSLSAGGLLVIHEFILEDTRDGPLFPALFSLNMLLGTESGQAYSQAELEQMMQAAGLREIHRIPLDSPNDSGLMAGRRP